MDGLDSGPQLVTIPQAAPRETALVQIESLLEGIVDAINDGTELRIPYRTIRTTHAPQDEDRPGDFVRFPGRSLQEVRRFEALFRIIELCHEALLSGNIITKRNIFYQNVDLFKSQAIVDDLVDNLAYTLDLGREDLNIVAAAKGLISGPLDLILRGDGIVNCNLSSDGILLPHISSIEKVYFHDAEWLLVIEKEVGYPDRLLDTVSYQLKATFRTLARSQYANNSLAGPGILLTAKGFPDLATRRFLSVLHSIRPRLKLCALVDFDPHGIAILRTYKSGSKRLGHEQDVAVPLLKWLGIRSNDILSANGQEVIDTYGSENQSSEESSSQESLCHSHDGSHEEHTRKRQKTRDSRHPVESLLTLSEGDRKKAIEVMDDIFSVDDDSVEQVRELQRMLMLNVKAEIQAVDDFGNVSRWLDEKLCRV